MHNPVCGLDEASTIGKAYLHDLMNSGLSKSIQLLWFYVMHSVWYRHCSPSLLFYV